ncbi:MAG: hypothetical protein HOH33_11970 [Verrucomicrobia bacterium]|nr:hypothetical protein [Verrucomicrobiota bacterium]
MSFYLLSIALGNQVTAIVNRVIQNADGTTKLEGVSYHLFFTALIFIAAILFAIYANFYKEQTYMQKEADAT